MSFGTNHQREKQANDLILGTYLGRGEGENCIVLCTKCEGFCGKKCHLAPIAEGRRCQLPCSGNQTIRYIRVRRLYLPIAEKRMGLSWTRNMLQRRECAYGPVLDTKHMRHFCKVTMPYGTNHQREKRVNGSVFGTNPGGKKVAITLSWASSR